MVMLYNGVEAGVFRKNVKGYTRSVLSKPRALGSPRRRLSGVGHSGIVPLADTARDQLGEADCRICAPSGLAAG